MVIFNSRFVALIKNRDGFITGITNGVPGSESNTSIDYICHVVRVELTAAS